MESSTDKKYPAKLLLIGEYSVLYGSKALAVPIDKFFVQWIHENGSPSHYELMQLLIYLMDHKSEFHFLNLEKLKTDINGGRSLYSTIPTGYGLGSSGAVCAAILDQYKIDECSIEETHRQLILLENYFHKKSSGIDPLISYYQSPMIIEDRPILLDKSYLTHLSNYNLFLIDSNVKRKTSEFVELFKTKMSDPIFSESYTQNIIALNNSLIDFFIDNQCFKFSEAWKELSTLSTYYYREMITSEIEKIWKPLFLKNNYLKINGAGGGGYYTLLCENQSFMDFSFSKMSI
ncbi:MAG: hypothetical protein WBB17_00730 [Saprospiraceae bacterium]